MNDRIAKLKTAEEALRLAANAKRHGNAELEAAAVQRSHELRAEAVT